MLYKLENGMTMIEDGVEIDNIKRNNDELEFDLKLENGFFSKTFKDGNSVLKGYYDYHSEYNSKIVFFIIRDKEKGLNKKYRVKMNLLEGTFKFNFIKD